jgi:hypothetical protein
MKLFTITIGVALNTRKAQLLTASSVGVAALTSYLLTDHLGPALGIAAGLLFTLLAIALLFVFALLACILYGCYRIVTWSPRRRQ